MLNIDFIYDTLGAFGPGWTVTPDNDDPAGLAPRCRRERTHRLSPVLEDSKRSLSFSLLDTAQYKRLQPIPNRQRFRRVPSH
jgi:hypothetical protein